MPRVTRAAARADPVDPDETGTAAEAALPDEPASLPLPESPAKPERMPLGEVKGNKTAHIEAEEQALLLPYEVDSQQKPGIVLHLDEVENAGVKSMKEKSVKVNGAVSGKKSTKKGKGTTAKRPELAAQFGQTMEQWTQTMKGKTLTAVGESSTSSTNGSQPSTPSGTPKKNKSKRKRAKKANNAAGSLISEAGISIEIQILEDPESVPGSPASEEAVMMLNDEQTSVFLLLRAVGLLDHKRADIAIQHGPEPVADDLPAKPSAAANATCQALLGAEFSHGASIAIKTPPAMLPENTVQESATETADAVQRLESIFKPNSFELAETSTLPLAEFIAHTIPRASGTKNDPIEAMDRLEEDIEATEASIANAQKHPSSRVKSNKAPSSKVNFTNAGKPAPPPRARPTVQQSNFKASAAPIARVARDAKVRPSIAANMNPKTTVHDKVKQRSPITALQTPPRVAKSNKPITTSSFQLPGEAAAARLKALKEEREKRREQKEKEEEQEKKRKAVARPFVPALARSTITRAPRASLMSSAVVRESRVTGTVAARSAPAVPARLSTVRSSRPSTVPSAPNLSSASRFRSSPAPAGSPATSKSKAAPVVPKAVRPGTTTSTARASSSASPPTGTARKVTGRSPLSSAKPLTSSVNNANTVRARVTSSESQSASENGNSKAATVSAKGREVHNRLKLAKELGEKEVKERLDAVRKAKEDAATRGKAAAKAWAEKRKANAAAAPASATNGNEDGVSAPAPIKAVQGMPTQVVM